MTPTYQLPSTCTRAPLGAGVLLPVILAAICLGSAGLALRVVFAAACGG